jgi:hypothetical protein
MGYRAIVKPPAPLRNRTSIPQSCSNYTLEYLTALSVFKKHTAESINEKLLKKKELRGFSPQANYTDRAIAAGQRS